jgi:hypothetical protein
MLKVCVLLFAARPPGVAHERRPLLPVPHALTSRLTSHTRTVSVRHDLSPPRRLTVTRAAPPR